MIPAPPSSFFIDLIQNAVNVLQRGVGCLAATRALLDRLLRFRLSASATLSLHRLARLQLLVALVVGILQDGIILLQLLLRLDILLDALPVFGAHILPAVAAEALLTLAVLHWAVSRGASLARSGLRSVLLFGSALQLVAVVFDYLEVVALALLGSHCRPGFWGGAVEAKGGRTAGRSRGLGREDLLQGCWHLVVQWWTLLLPLEGIVVLPFLTMLRTHLLRQRHRVHSDCSRVKGWSGNV